MIVPLAGFVLLCGLWSVYWLIANAVAQGYAAAEREKLAGRGISLSCAAESWGGFPFRFEFRCAGPEVRLADGRSFRSAALLIVAQAYNPARVIALIDGPSQLPLGTFRHDRIIASASFRGSGLPQVDVQVANLVQEGLLETKALEIHTRPLGEASGEWAVSVTGGKYFLPDKPPVSLDRAEMRGTFAAGQPAEVTFFNVRQADVTVEGKGRVTLDAQHRLAGRLAAETNDLTALMAALDPHIEITAAARQGINAMLVFMAKKAKVDLAAENGALFIGPLQVGELTPLY